MISRRSAIVFLATCLSPYVSSLASANAKPRTVRESEPRTRRVSLVVNTSHWSYDQRGGIVEIGAVELSGSEFTGHQFHAFSNPGCEIEDAMHEEHGLSQVFLASALDFSEVAGSLLSFIDRAELVMAEQREAAWLNREFSLLQMPVGSLNEKRVSYTFDMYRSAYSNQPNELVRSGLRHLHGISKSVPFQNAVERASVLAHAYIHLRHLGEIGNPTPA